VRAETSFGEKPKYSWLFCEIDELSRKIVGRSKICGDQAERKIGGSGTREAQSIGKEPNFSPEHHLSFSVFQTLIKNPHRLAQSRPALQTQSSSRFFFPEYESFPRKLLR